MIKLEYNKTLPAVCETYFTEIINVSPNNYEELPQSI